MAAGPNPNCWQAMYIRCIILKRNMHFNCGMHDSVATCTAWYQIELIMILLCVMLFKPADPIDGSSDAQAGRIVLTQSDSHNSLMSLSDSAGSVVLIDVCKCNNTCT